jgi:UDP-N-acetylglucosamine--N-acetylmuramyl-(pentapeptide) pyrophosphoryl-undecaprenol N-acetylglucosamine transferase
VTNNHQEKNALSVANAGSAELILEPNLTGELLFTRIQKLIANPILLDSMHLAALKLGMADSAERIVREVKKII